MSETPRQLEVVVVGFTKDIIGLKQQLHALHYCQVNNE